MRSLEQALAAMGGLAVRTQTQHVPLAQALGQVLAQDVLAASDQPPFDRTTMDGFAVVLQEGRSTFDVVATVLAGERYEGALAPGQAVRIMTGAPCPRGTTVVPIERTDGGPQGPTGTVSIDPEALEPGKNIAWQGQDARAGERVLRAGTRLAPQTISSAAMAGADRLSIYVPPRIGIVTTGDEVGAEGPAAVRNSNGPLLAALCDSLRVPHRSFHAVDEVQALRSTLRQAAQASEIVVTVGGVSMGTADLVPGTVRELGFDPVLHKVAIQPGKPVLLAQHTNGKCFLGLPGNPVSVLVTAHLFLAKLIGRFCGDWSPRWQPASLACDWTHRGRRRLFLPARRVGAAVEPVAWNGSGDFYSAARADGLLDLAAGGSWKAGETLRFLPYLGHHSGECGE